MSDLISRQAAIEAIENTNWYHINKNGELVRGANSQEHEPLYRASEIYAALEEVPSAQPTLYGYKIEHLAYIATAMEKEGVTAEYAVRTFDDISRALRMIIEEAQEKIMETLNERYDLQTGGD